MIQCLGFISKEKSFFKYNKYSNLIQFKTLLNIRGIRSKSDSFLICPNIEIICLL